VRDLPATELVVNKRQNAIPSDSQPTTATHISSSHPKPTRKSYKPGLVKAAVIAKALIGEHNSKIARDLNIDRSTVRTILDSSTIRQQIEEGRSDCVRMIPRSIRVIDQRLEKGSETAALAILRGTQVLVNAPLAANQTNIQANVWLQLQQSRESEQQKPIEVEAKPVLEP
jgi:hypothetical protein